jgi:hypothetical protein
MMISGNLMIIFGYGHRPDSPLNRFTVCLFVNKLMKRSAWVEVQVAWPREVVQTVLVAWLWSSCTASPCSLALEKVYAKS